MEGNFNKSLYAHPRPHPPSSMFPQASNLMINGGHFANVEGDYHYSVNRDTGLNNLSQHIATGAMFNSAERFPPGKCHPGTRENAIRIIKDWIVDPTPTNGVLWLYGPAGSGKSSIAQSIAELLWELHRDKYGGSFFFASGNIMGRGDGDKLFSTLAHQLAVNFPAIRPLLNDALLNDPTLPTKSLDVQIQALIIDPIRLTPNWPAHTPTVIIDGLDECAGSANQTNILSLIFQSLSGHNIPLRFLIASRPEWWIRDSFEVGPLLNITQSISLNDIGDADKDIEKYLVAEFDNICKRHNHIMHTVEQPWPSARIVRRFVEEASSQFIYASTVVMFIGYSSDFCDPREQLRILTTSGPHRAAAFSNLDVLYAAILSRIPASHRAALRLVLAGILLDLQEQSIEIFLGVDAGEIALILAALSSLIEIRQKAYRGEDALKMLYGPSGAPEESHIEFCHFSFQEFLQNECRSGQYFVDVAAIADQFMRSFFELIGDGLERKPKIEQHQSYTMRTIQLNWLLGTISNFPFEVCSIGTLDILLENLDNRIKVFMASDVSHNPYNIYLLQYLDLLSHFPDIIGERRPSILFPPSFGQTVARAGNEIVRLLVENDLAITPLLYYGGLGREFGIADVHLLPEVDIAREIHHCLLCIGWSGEDPQGSEAYIHTLQPLKYYILNCEGGEWISRWNSQAMSLLCLCLTILRNDIMKFAEDPDDPDLLPHDAIDLRMSILCLYFRDDQLSVSKIKELLQNPDGRLFLTLILDIRLWNSFRKQKNLEDGRGAWGESLTLAVMEWLHELLRDPQSKLLIAEYDESLPRAMSQTIASLYKQHFLPDCQTHRYLTELTVFNNKAPSLSAILHLTSPPDDSEAYVLQEEKTPLLYLRQPGFWYLWAFQTEFFSRDSESQYPVDGPLIERSSWYPHLAAYLLNLQVKHHYHLLHPDFEGHDESIKVFHPYIVECLSYAYPTDHNLTALRALRFLSPRISPPWHPPLGFRSAIFDLLLKYDCSSVPIADLANFMGWLISLTEDINR